MAIQVPDTWQPVRILRALDRNSRSLGWPPENRNTSEMETWCTKHCRGNWQIDFDDNSVATFWFANRGDAAEFAVRWFPFKCV
ncbi:MAG: hypothetical protein ACKVGZ_15620 [Alphaproteobacteria bacterium]|jgi:hypothetical protein